MRISDWSSDVCSSDLAGKPSRKRDRHLRAEPPSGRSGHPLVPDRPGRFGDERACRHERQRKKTVSVVRAKILRDHRADRRTDEMHLRKCRSEEHTSELQSLMRISYAVFCLKKTN